MTPWPIRKIIRLMLRSTSVARATRQITEEGQLSADIARSLGPDKVATPATVGMMPGVDADMRGWSVAQILEHNVIVNRVFTDIVDHLVRGEDYVSDLDPKRDVMPSAEAGVEQIELFETTVAAHLERVTGLSDEQLAATDTRPHPLFGPLNARQWHAMFGFHLKLHRRQAEAVSKILQTGD